MDDDAAYPERVQDATHGAFVAVELFGQFGARQPRPSGQVEELDGDWDNAVAAYAANSGW